MSDPQGILWSNGNALYFDEEGQQIPGYQSHGWSGIHLFKENYPDADLYVGDWQSKQRLEISEDVLRHIKEA